MNVYFDADLPKNSVNIQVPVHQLDPSVLMLVILRRAETECLEGFENRLASPFRGVRNVPDGIDFFVLTLPVWRFIDLCRRQMLHSLLPQSATSFLTPLVEERCAPSYAKRSDGKVVSFICSSDHLRRVVGKYEIVRLEDVLFQLLASVLASPIDCDLQVKQMSSNTVMPVLTQSVEDISVASVTAHRGERAYLDTCVSALSRQHSARVRQILIGLDDTNLREYAALAKLYPSATWCYATDPPIGPYVIRQYLASLATADYLLWQDSDDVSCSNRLVELLRCLQDFEVEMVGSHALEVDEICGEVRAVRYPLDVTAILADNTRDSACADANEPFLHATAVILRTAFLQAGGFSTNRRIASDSQFLLRAHFTMKVRNVDAFLYIRRIHRKALTVAEDTRIGNDYRRNLGQRWNSDFRGIKEGRLRLEDSSLVAETCQIPPVVLPLEWDKRLLG